MKIKITTPKILCTALIAAGMMFSVSCKKDAATSSTVTEADAAQVTTDAVIPSTGGMTASFSSSVSVANNAAVVLTCGLAKDSTFTAASATGAIPAYSFNYNWNYLLTCGIPNKFNFNFTGAGTYTGSLFTAAYNSTGAYVLTENASTYSYASSYSRTGTFTSKVARQNTFTSDIEITSSNVIIDKTTQIITSGTATVSIKATSTSGKSVTYGGKITFLGNKKATLVLNSGVPYNIAWS